MNTYTQIRKIRELHHCISSKNKLGNDHFRLDRSETARYFAQHPKWKTRIIQYFQLLKKQKIRIVHVDICGRTNARSLGSEKSHCFALKTNEFVKKVSQETSFFDGDIFDEKDFYNFLQTIKNEQPALVTFEPVAGLQDYGPEKKIEGITLYKKITYSVLIKRLHSIVKIMRPGGLIYIERPFQLDVADFADAFFGKPRNQFTICLAMKKIARKLKCKIEINGTINGTYFLLQTKLKAPS